MTPSSAAAPGIRKRRGHFFLLRNGLKLCEVCSNWWLHKYAPSISSEAFEGGPAEIICRRRQVNNRAGSSWGTVVQVWGIYGFIGKIGFYRSKPALWIVPDNTQGAIECLSVLMAAVFWINQSLEQHPQIQQQSNLDVIKGFDNSAATIEWRRKCSCHCSKYLNNKFEYLNNKQSLGVTSCK